MPDPVFGELLWGRLKHITIIPQLRVEMPMEDCAKCGQNVPLNEANCLVCGTFKGYPNVRAAQAEQSALTSRHADVLATIDDPLRKKNVATFETAVKASKAVVNADGRYLETFLSNGNALWATYASLVKADARQSAEEKFDQRRAGVDGKLFGTKGSSEIRFAALSLDGAGLNSYGPYSVTLKDIAIDARASVLEENSFFFLERHKVTPAADIPVGYRSDWHNRHILATAKLAAKIDESTVADEFATILMSSTGDRATDEFMEVLIYGPYNRNAIEKVRGPRLPKPKIEKARKLVIKDLLASIGATWDDE